MNDLVVEPYYPLNVRRITDTGSNHYIGLVDETTALKFPHIRGELNAVNNESLIYQRLGKHPSIINYKGRHPDGTILQYAPNGSLETYLRQNPVVSIERV